MDYLKKEETLILRDEKGELLPLEIVLELLPDKPTIRATPLTKGEIQKILSPGGEEDKLKLEDEIICRHCIEPSYTIQEFEFLKPGIYGAIKTAILSLSVGTDQKNIQDAATQQAMDEVNKKKS